MPLDSSISSPSNTAVCRLETPVPPDLSFLGYLAGPKIGAVVYNSAHSHITPLAMLTAGFGFAPPLLLSVAIIWLAHTGFDRALGYGLKYAAGFGLTHLGRIGRQTKTRAF